MTTLNADAARAARAAGAHAMTDVTGFGLLGHLHELTAASGLAAEVDAEAVPAIDGVEALLRGDDAVSGGSRRNREHAETFTQLRRRRRRVAPPAGLRRHHLGRPAGRGGGGARRRHPRRRRRAARRGSSRQHQREPWIICLRRGAARARWPNRPSKPGSRGNPAVGRFDSFAAPSPDARRTGAATPAHGRHRRAHRPRQDGPRPRAHRARHGSAPGGAGARHVDRPRLRPARRRRPAAVARRRAGARAVRAHDGRRSDGRGPVPARRRRRRRRDAADGRARGRAARARRARGVVAITKTDIADPPGRARRCARWSARASRSSPAPPAPAPASSTSAPRSRMSPRAPAAAAPEGRPCCTSTARSRPRGGTVVTGTLWSGSSAAATASPAARRRRRAGARGPGPRRGGRAGGRRAAGRGEPRRRPRRRDRRGDVVAGGDAGLQPAWILDVALELGDAAIPRRVQIHHGTRETPARIADREPGRWQLRCERPLIAPRRRSLRGALDPPPGTLGGGVVLDPAARRTRRPARPNGPRPPRRQRRAEPRPLSETALTLERTLREAADRPPRDTELGDGAEAALAELRAAGRAVRLDRDDAHPPRGARRACASGSRRSSRPRARSRWRACATSSTPPPLRPGAAGGARRRPVTLRLPDDRRDPAASTSLLTETRRVKGRSAAG